MTTNELREKYLEFFSARGGSASGGKSKGHTIIPSASLIPENDPTVLFTTAGMHPLVPYLLGEKHPGGDKLTDVQKCIRTGDIDEVGDNWHLTFFEMLGNWSLGSYFKKEAIEMSFEFLTKELNIPVERLAVSVFEGDDDALFDKESYDMWKSVGIPEERIYKYNKKENWWGPAGQTGPCGPDTEMFYITDKEACGADCQPSCSCGKYVEIWNDVFMEYYKNEKGEYEKAKQKNVDTGMGLERTVAILNGYDSVYKVDTMWPIIEKIEEISQLSYGDANFGEVKRSDGNISGDLVPIENEKGEWVGLSPSQVKNSMRIIADHIRAAVMIMGDQHGVAPSNVDQGYVVRKLIRRAIRHGKKLGIEKNFCSDIAEVVIDIFKDVYSEIENNKDFVLSKMKKEEEKFQSTLEQGLKEFEKGTDPFVLFTTYGFPIELTRELAKEKGIEIDEEDFNKKMQGHQDLSRKGAEQKFKGGLADHGEMSVKYHTATHLLHAALREVLGNHVEQKGSNITADRLRFDFSHPEKMTDEEKQKVTDLVNAVIERDYPISFEELSIDEAKEKGAIGLFEDKYAKKVKVYTVGDPSGKASADLGSKTFSMEICGGPHVEHTGELGKFRIKKEESSSSGIRRIKAVLE